MFWRTTVIRDTAIKNNCYKMDKTNIKTGFKVEIIVQISQSRKFEIVDFIQSFLAMQHFRDEYKEFLSLYKLFWKNNRQTWHFIVIKNNCPKMENNNIKTGSQVEIFEEMLQSRKFEIVNIIYSSLAIQHARDEYKEFLIISKLFLEEQPSNETLYCYKE